MNLYEYIEQLHRDFSWDLIDQIDQDDSIGPRDVKEVIDFFIRDLRANHCLPGKIWLTLTGIAAYCQEHNHLTSRQLRYALVNISQYWDQTNLNFG